MNSQSVQRVLMGSKSSGGSSKRFLGQSSKGIKLLGSTTKAVNRLGVHSPMLNKANSIAQNHLMPLIEANM